MSAGVPQLAALRSLRNQARAEFFRELGLAKVDLAPAVLKRRAVTEAKQKALPVAQQAMVIASDSRGVVATTGTMLLLWLARKPIFSAASGLFARYRARKTATGRAKLQVADYWRKLKEYADE